MSNRQRSITATERRRRAWVLYLKGYTQAEIATELHISPQAVSKALRKAQQLAHSELSAEINAYTAQQLARLEYLYGQALRSWEHSKGTRARKTLRTRGIGPGAEQDAQITTTESLGDPRYLTAALTALADQRKLLGLDAPKKHAIVHARPAVDLDDDALDRELLELSARLSLPPPKGHNV